MNSLLSDDSQFRVSKDYLDFENLMKIEARATERFREVGSSAGTGFISAAKAPPA